MTHELTNAYALFLIDGKLHGIDSAFVRSFLHLSEVFSIPDKPEYCRGLIRYGDLMIPAIDLRVFLKMRSAETDAQELSQMMKKRKADHVHWMDTLFRSVTENTPFTLATDCHECAFGKWFDAYQTDDIGMKQYLRRFKKPHEAIHNIAQKALERRDKRDLDGALEIIEQTRNNELREMLALFDEFDAAYSASRKEIVIVLSDDISTAGIIVDEILALEPLKEANTNGPANGHLSTAGTILVGTREQSGEVVAIFDAMRVL